jgi:hypothetical protein
MAKKAPITKSKKPRQAPAEWQDAVDASEAQADSPKGGVIHEDGTPYVIEALDDAARAVTAGEMSRLVEERAEVREEYLDASRGFRDRLKGLDDRIRELAGEYNKRERKVPAQKTLPGTEAHA